MSPPRQSNFRGRRALILHRANGDTGRLARQLERLGMIVECAWPDFPAGGEFADVVLFDADNGHPGMWPWAEGEAPVPLIALFGSELPSRLEWALDQGISAHISKPIRSSGVFSALVVAFANFAAAAEAAARLARLEARLAARPLVLHTLVALMTKCGLTEEEAFACLRRAAMNERLTIEDFCARLDEFRLAALTRRLMPVAGQGGRK